MMGKFADLTGQRFGRLTVIGRGNNVKYPCGVVSTTIRCKCDCGNIKNITRSNLLSGNTKSCGCYRAEWAAEHMREIGKRSYKKVTKEQRN